MLSRVGRASEQKNRMPQTVLGGHATRTLRPLGSGFSTTMAPNERWERWHSPRSLTTYDGSLPALTVDWNSTYSESPSAPNSRPMPDCLKPPNGQLVSSVYMLMP